MDSLLFNLGIGALLALAFYNLLLYLAYDDESYISLFFMQFFWCVEFGHTLFPAVTGHELYQPLRYSCILIGVSFGLQLTRQYLDIVDFSRFVDNLVLLLIKLGLALVVLLPLLEYREWYVISFLLLASLVTMIVALRAVWLSRPLSGLFFAAVASFVFLTVLPALLNGLSSGFFKKISAVSNYLQWLGILLSLLFIAAIQVRHTRQLRSEHARVKAAGEARSHFLNVMSHEMRAPLHVLVGINHLLQDSPTVEQQKDYLEKMDMAAKSLLAISSNTLDLSQLDNDSEKFVLKRKPFDLNRLLSEMNDLFGISAQQKGLSLEVEPLETSLPILLGDRERLLQVLFNLLDNAVKYTEKGEIRLTCKLLDIDDQQATLAFHVYDTGIGIPVKHRDSLFQPFYRVNSRYGEKQSGTGLGLPISHQLVKKMGGMLAVENLPKQGSHFFFTLSFPLFYGPEVEHIHAQKAGNEAPLSLQGIRVLIVDDDEMNRIIGAKLLRNRGAIVDEAEDGLVAISKVQRQKFDLVFMDISMPGLDGYETVRRIKTKGFSDLPIVALTALVSTEERGRCLLAGMDDYLAKPFQLDSMERMVLKHSQK